MNQGKLIIQIDTDLKDIVPEFMAIRTKDVTLLKSYIVNQDFDHIIKVGHRIKGSSASYGFLEMSEIGRQLEYAGKIKDLNLIKKYVESLENYLLSVEITYSSAA